MIMISLLKQLSGFGFVTTTEVTNVRTCSNEMIEMEMNAVYSIRGCRGTSPSRNRKLSVSKLKSSHFQYHNKFVPRPLDIDTFKSTNGGFVPEESALFNWSSARYIE